MEVLRSHKYNSEMIFFFLGLSVYMLLWCGLVLVLGGFRGFVCVSVCLCVLGVWHLILFYSFNKPQ